MIFDFEPKQLPHPHVKSLKGKHRLEFLNRDKIPYFVKESWIEDWAFDSYEKDSDVKFFTYHTSLGLLKQTMLENNNIGADGSLTVRLIFKYFDPKILKFPNPYVLEEFVASKADSAFDKDMKALLQNSEDADFKIKTKDGVTFNVHKLILKSRVPMFRAMFSTEMLEKSSGMVETPEISSGAMEILLHYVYTGKLHPNLKEWKQYVHEVINGANQYDLQGLIKFYDCMLITFCTDLDANDLLEVAKLHGLKQAEEDIGKWIAGVAF